MEEHCERWPGMGEAMLSGDILRGLVNNTHGIPQTNFCKDSKRYLLLIFTELPKPVNPSTTIRYDIKRKMRRNLESYDLLGRKLATLVNESKDEGSYTVNFDASRLPSGVYIYTLRVNNFFSSRKMTVLK